MSCLNGNGTSATSCFCLFPRGSNLSFRLIGRLLIVIILSGTRGFYWLEPEYFKSLSSGENKELTTLRLTSKPDDLFSLFFENCLTQTCRKTKVFLSLFFFPSWRR